MTWVSELIQLLPVFVGYAAPGFLLVFSFAWAASIQLRLEKSTIILSFVCSYLIWETVGKSSQMLSAGANFIVCFLSVACGFFSAIIYKKEKTNTILANLGFKRTTNNSIWDDVIGEGRWVCIWSDQDTVYYCGSFKYQKSEDDAIYLALSTYYTADKEGKVIDNYTADRDRIVLFQIKDISKMIIASSDPLGHFKTIKSKEDMHHA